MKEYKYPRCVSKRWRTGSADKKKGRGSDNGIWAGMGNREKEIGGDWRKGIRLFVMVWTVMEYGAKIWRWKEREGIKKTHEKYIR